MLAGVTRGVKGEVVRSRAKVRMRETGWQQSEYEAFQLAMPCGVREGRALGGEGAK